MQVPVPAVGLLHESASGDALVVGREVAVTQLVQALGAFGERYRYELYCPPRQTESIRTALSAASRITVHSRRALMADKRSFAAWHDNELDTFLPFALRARTGATYPVTLVHHTISMKSLLHMLLLRLLLSKPQPHDAIVCTSSAAQRALATLIDGVAERFNAQHGTSLAYTGRYASIPLGCDTDRLHPIDRLEARRTLEIDPAEIVLLWLGRFSIIDKADLMPLLFAFEELVRTNPQHRLRLVCAGSERPGERFGTVLGDYARSIGLGDRVRIITEEHRIGPWKAHLYSAADVFISPVDNIQESFGLSPVEAMACGVPQVVSDWNGYRDTVVDGETGFLVPTTWAPCHDGLEEAALMSDMPFDHLALAQSVAVDVPALVAALQRLIDNPELRAKMAEASRKRAERLYSWRTVIAHYEALWEELGAQAASAPAPRDGADYALPRYQAAFGHYASRQLADDLELYLSERGRALVSGERDLASHYNVDWQYLDLALLRRILGGFAKLAGKPLTTARIVGVLGRGDSPRDLEAQVQRHVLWLLKYDYVRFGP